MTRFDLDMDGSMEPSEHGRWVRYEDAQRTWVGLTLEELSEIYNFTDWNMVDSWGYERAIEAKLKEKNNGFA